MATWVQIWVKMGSKKRSFEAFWASVSSQKALFGVNLGSQNLKVVQILKVGFSKPESGTFWGKSQSHKVKKVGFLGEKSKTFSP